MYEALFLSVHVAIEGFIEELFLGLLVRSRGVRFHYRTLFLDHFEMDV